MAKIKAIDLLKQELELFLGNPSLVKKQKGWSQKQYDEHIALLEQKIMQSKRGKSSKRKGGSYELAIAKKFKEAFNIELVRTPSSGGFKKDSRATNIKGDIANLDESIDFKLHIECKNQKAWSLPSWLKQAEEDCPAGHYPTVIIHRAQRIEEGKRTETADDFVVMRLEDFFRVVDKSKVLEPKGMKK